MRSSRKYGFWSRLWLFFFPFLFPPKKRKEEMRMNSKNRDQKSCLSALSIYLFCLSPGERDEGKAGEVGKKINISASAFAK